MSELVPQHKNQSALPVETNSVALYLQKCTREMAVVETAVLSEELTDAQILYHKLKGGVLAEN